MVEANLFDRTLKIMTRNHAEIFVRLALPNAPVELVGSPENVELSLPVQPVDFAHRIRYAGQEHLLHLEFQFEHFRDFPRRICATHGALTQQFKLPVLSYAVYLKYRKSPLPHEYVVKLDKIAIHRFTYPVLKLWDYVDGIYTGEYRELAPLLVMLERTPNERTLERERELILAEPDIEKRADLLGLAVDIAARNFDPRVLHRIFRREWEEMRPKTTTQELLDIFYGPEVEERVQQGQQTAQRETVLLILDKRFTLTEQQTKLLTAQLKTIQSLAQLKALVSHAVDVFSLLDFQRILAEMVAQAQLPSPTNIQ